MELAEELELALASPMLAESRMRLTSLVLTEVQSWLMGLVGPEFQAVVLAACHAAHPLLPLALR